MNWDIIENYLALATTIGFWVVKDLATYLLAILIHCRSGAINKEYIKDLTKQLLSSFFHLPCEFIAVSIGFLIGQIVFLIQSTSTADTVQLQSIILSLSGKIILCCFCMFIAPMLCGLLTDIVDDLIQNPKNSKWTKFLGFLGFLAIFFITTVLMLNFLSISNAFYT